MDLERIKQNFRLRSGRSKKNSKKSKAQTSVDTGTTAQKENTRPSTSHQLNGRANTPSASKTSANRQSPRSDAQITKREEQEDGQVEEPEQKALSPEPEDKPGSPQAENEQDMQMNGKQDQEETGLASPKPDDRGQTSHQDSTTSTPTRDMRDQQKAQISSGDSEPDDFDLRPPAPRPKPPSVEATAELLFSAGHLNTTLHTPALLAKFTAFLQKYRPQDHPLLLRYLETSKAIGAIEYANAVAEAAPALPETIEGNAKETSNVAATINESFKEACSSAFETLLYSSLPLFITYNLVRTVSECLIDEITGRSTTYMRDMVDGLSEVFCLTDPTQEDNPIIYASEEFYRLTGYGPEYVIGHNCRFLQGQKTAQASPKRIRAGLDAGEEIYETLLNYRRDGRPFINVLMIAPLHDDKGNVKYHIGAQVDVSRLVEGGRVLDSFQRHLAKRDADSKREARTRARGENSENSKKKRALEKLRELSELFDLEESAVVRSNSRSTSLDREDDVRSIGSGNARRRFVDSDASDDENEEEAETDQQDWKLGQSGLSGKLPGVYEKYMLIRAAPSLRIVFTSSKLHKFGRITQNPFLSHVAAPAGTLSGLAESFKDGIPVSAKINFMPQRTDQRYGTKIPPSERHEDGKYGRACWISATPLLGGDDRVGVWIVIFVEKAQAKAQRARAKQQPNYNLQDLKAEASPQKSSTDRPPEQRIPGPPGTNQKKEGEKKNYEQPIKPKRLDAPINFTVRRQQSQRSATAYQYRAASPVEEYHSADEMDSDSPIAPAPRAVMPPQTPTYEIADEESYVHPKSGELTTPSSNRLRIDPDDEVDREGSEASSPKDYDAISEHFEEVAAPEDPNHIPPSIPSDHESMSDESKSDTQKTTPERPRSSEKDQNFGLYSTETIRRQHTPPPSSPRKTPSPGARPQQHEATPATTESHQTQNSRQSGNLPAGLGYMDYLRYPGSGRKLPKGEARRGRTKARNNSGSDPWSESDCPKSPYSID